MTNKINKSAEDLHIDSSTFKQLTIFEKKAIWNSIQIRLIRKGPLEEMREWVSANYPFTTKEDKPRSLMAAILRAWDEFDI